MGLLATLFGLVAAFFGGLTLVKLKGRATLLFIVKMLGNGLVLVWGLLGVIGALLGLRKRNPLAIALGGFGAAMAARHIGRTTTEHDGFEKAFGPNWLERIPAQQRHRFGLDRGVLPAQPLPKDVRRTGDVEIGTAAVGTPLLADLWQPPRDVPPTGVTLVYLHGSAWHYLDKNTGTEPFFTRLAGQGHTILDVAYSLAPEATLDDMMDDVKRAILWAKEHAEELRTDPAKIVMGGGSAGAHLALLAAFTPNHPSFQPEGTTADTSVAAVISYYGMPDLLAIHRYMVGTMSDLHKGDSELVEAWTEGAEEILAKAYVPPVELLPNILGGTPNEVPERYTWGSPTHYVGPHCPPTLQIIGTHDFAVQLEPVRALHKKLQAAGVPAVLVEISDAEHGFDLAFPLISPSAQAATYDAERFLAYVAHTTTEAASPTTRATESNS